MKSLAVRLAFGNACQQYMQTEHLPNKTSKINGVNSIDNDLMWNIYDKD